MAPTAAAVPLVLILLSWLSFSAINRGAERFDRALGALDRFSMSENALQRDILAARAGRLRNYDPLVAEGKALDAAIGQLRQAASGDAALDAATGRLAAAVAAQAPQIETFKSQNALLQNSLAYFGLYSTQLGSADRTGSMGRIVSGLAAAMLHLTLDVSPATADEVQTWLQELATQVPAQDDAATVQALLAHARLLHQLLPSIDHTLAALQAVPQKRERDALSGTILAHQAASRQTAREYRLLLYFTSLLLVAALVHLGLRLRANTLALQRRAQLEHVIAGISTGLINAQTTAIAEHVRAALAELSDRVGADRAYFVARGRPQLRYVWSRGGNPDPPGWPDQASTVASQVRRDGDAIIYIPSVGHMPPGQARDTLEAADVLGWLCIPVRSGASGLPMLGFDSLRAELAAGCDEFDLLRMALDALANAVGRSLLEQETTRLRQRLRRSRRMETVGALASGIAHNFNNVVAAIQGYAEIAREQLADDSAAVGNIFEIQKAGERARELIDQILAFGRPRAARLVPIDLRDLVNEAASLLRVSLPKEIELVVTQAPERASLAGERGQLQQVILNLCNNASQALDGVGIVHLETGLHRIARPRRLSHGELRAGLYACIAVSDTGRGMEGALLNRIFEPFFTTRATGNGLGLATVQQIIREHGGAMHVRSAPLAGSRFEAWLPCSLIDSAQTSRTPAAPALGHGETVLVVDEAAEQLLRDEEILAALGYEPVGFGRADDALTACRTAPGRFDMALLGPLAPSRSTLDVAGALHAIRPDLPIVLAAAGTDDMTADALVEAGVSDVVHWPIVATEMAVALAGGSRVARPGGLPQGEPRRPSRA